MQILDGKNHRRGGYDRIALDVIVHILNTGRFGAFEFPDLLQRYTAEQMDSARKTFIETFQALVDQWIDSGINPDGTETPSERYVRGLPKGYSESLFDVLYSWLNRNMPMPALMNDGKIGILHQPPIIGRVEIDTYPRESAIFFLSELLDAPAPDRLARCSNPKCRTYFARKRKCKGVIKRGSYCGKCELIGAAERTRLSRQHRKSQQIKFASMVWSEWRHSNRSPDRAEYVAKQVNRQFPQWPPIHGKWVTQNRNEIMHVQRSADSSLELRSLSE